MTALAALLLALAGSGVAPGRAAALHPADGPDADVRIQIRDEAVTLSIALNLAFLDAILDLPREQPDALAEVEADALRAELFEHLSAANTVAIDGVPVTPVEGAFHVVDAPPELVPLFPRFGARALIKVQLDFVYSAKAPPSSVLVRWGPFPPDAVLADLQDPPPPVQIVAQLTAEGETGLVTFTRDEPEYLWRTSGVSREERFLPVPAVGQASAREIPLVSAALALAALAVLFAALRPSSSPRLRRAAPIAMLALFAGAALARGTARVALSGSAAALPDSAAALEIFRPLHANIYRAFDYDDESDVYDALARSVEGELLDELYGEIYRGLVLQEAGGAVSRVTSVRLLEAEVHDLGERPPDGRAAFDVEATWQVEGAVYHWGHAHSRTNEYRARYTVRAGEDGWRIGASQVLAERRVDAAPLGPAPPDGFEAREKPVESLPPELKEL